MEGSFNGLLLGILVVLAIAVGIDTLARPLANPDEGRYSEIAREMASSGDWVTPRLNGIKYFEKPPLQYWATALSLKLFGENEYAARLYGALCAVGILALVGFTARRLWGAETGMASMLALVSSPYFMALGTIVTLDMGLTLWTTATFCAYLVAEFSPAGSRERRRWMLAAWAGIALAVLSKGLIGIVFPGAALGLACILRRDFSPLARMEWGRGIVLFLALAAPWFVLVSLANPEFPRFFFVHEHFERFVSTVHRRSEPWWYFIPILIAGFLPWMLALPAAILRAWREEARVEGPRPLRFALLWSAFVLLFFSASGSKLPAYILPAFPPLALVLGRYLSAADTKRLALMAAPIAVVAVVLGVAGWQAPDLAKEEWTRVLYMEARPWAVAGATAFCASVVAAAVMLRRGRRWPALVAIAVGTVLLIDCVEDAYETLSPRQSGLIVAEKMRPYLSAVPRLYSVRHYDQTVPFYIGRTMTLVEYVDEFEPGLKSEPGRDLPSVDLFAPDWLRPGDALAIMHPGTFETLRKDGLPMQVLHEDPRRVLVRKP